jgi:4-amino-4-deoxy-L-arabinose transferase-like glycosyltransferase
MLTVETTREVPELLGGFERTSPNSPETISGLRGCVPYLLFTVCASLYLLPFMRLLLHATDEGTLVYGAVRVVRGQMLGQDFFEALGPGTFYWLALFFKLFGITFLATRICLFVSSLGTALAIYFLSRRVCRSYQLLPCILVFATYFYTIWPEISHHVDSNCFGLLAVMCMILWQDSRRSWLLLAAGVLDGATTLILQPKGILLLLAFFVWLWIQHRRHVTSLTALVWVAGGCLGVVASMLGYFWTRNALHDLIYANVIWPSHNYGPTYSVPYAFLLLEHFKHWIVPMNGLNWTVGMAAVLFIPFLFVAALPALLLCLGVRRGIRDIRPEILLYWLAGFAFWFSEIHRKDIAHLVFGSPLLVILCVFYLQERRNKGFNLALQALSIVSVCLV